MKKRIFERTTDGHEGMVIEDGKAIRFRTQETDSYYQENQFYRNNIDKAAVTRNWALPVANIPYADYQELIKRNPELSNPDAKIRTREWLKLLRSTACEQLRTVRKNLIPEDPEPDSGSILLPYKGKDSEMQ